MEERWKKLDDSEAIKKAEAGNKVTTIKVGGRIHADHLTYLTASPGIGAFESPLTGVDPEDRFYFRRVRLELSGDIFENMLWRIQVDFATPTIPQFKDVYIGLKELPANQMLLIGHQKRPLGLDHWNSSRHNIFMERPLVVEAFNPDARRPGIGVWGHTDNEAMFWQYGTYLLEDSQTDGQYIGDSYQPSVNARIGGSPWYDESSGGRGWFHWGLAGMAAFPDGDASPLDSYSNEARFQTRSEERSSSRWINTGRIANADFYAIGGLEAMLNIGAWHFCGEYQSAWVNRPGAASGLNFHGGYIQAAYFLTGEHMAYERATGQLARAEPFERFFLVEKGASWGAWQVAARYSYLILTDGDIRGGVEHNTTIAMNWFWNSHARVMFDVTYGDIEDRQASLGFTGGTFCSASTRFAIDF